MRQRQMLLASGLRLAAAVALPAAVQRPGSSRAAWSARREQRGVCGGTRAHRWLVDAGVGTGTAPAGTPVETCENTMAHELRYSFMLGSEP